MNLFPVVILAGGLATRLRPLTNSIPKSMVIIGGEPFIAHQLRLLQRNGIRKVVLCIGYLGEQIIDFVSTGHQFGIEVSYCPDGPTLLGTGGAIKQALPLLDECFFVLYGDSYLPCHYAAIQRHFLATQKLAMMTVFHNQGQWDKSNVEFTDNTILAYDKQVQTNRMHYIDYGLGIFTHQAFTYLTGANYNLAQLYQELLAQQQLAAFEVTERFYEAGSFTGIQELEQYLAQKQIISKGSVDSLL
ncbi:MAG: Nucleotidyl transferase [uncultured bacterium]|nr:MAG: Nucleotidyl transferase [uncultured bacterium]OGT45959.1 MAG: nucleotidyl transferase [Gammaproteobacteria bacterium RIFCSPHIGHO2_12_FULL_41_20]